MKPYIRLSDYRELVRPASPIFAFVVPWLFVLIFLQIPLCGIIKPVYSSFYWIILGNMVTSLLVAVVTQTVFPQKLESTSTQFHGIGISGALKQATYGLIAIYFIIQVIQTVYFQGIPLLWLISGSQKTYFDYGFSSLNGLLNAIYLLSTTIMFLICLKERGRGQYLIMIAMFAMPIILVSRQLLMSASLQIICCLLLYNPKMIKKVAIAMVGLLCMFVVVGNIRTGITHLAAILEPNDYIPTSLYSLLWIYAYAVTPFNNINVAMDAITPLGFPYYEISSLLPTIFRSTWLLGDWADTGFSLVHDEMNVSSFYLSPLLDFGSIYAFCFMVGFQILLFLSYRRAKRTKSWIDIVEYAVLYMVMVLSIFSNLLLFLPVVAQLAIIEICKWRIRRRREIIVIGRDSL